MNIVPKYQKGNYIAQQDAIRNYKPKQPQEKYAIQTKQPTISKDNRSSWQKQQSQSKAQQGYKDYMESKQTQKGLDNLNGFLNFTDYVGLATGAGSLISSGVKYAGKKLVKRGVKPLVKEKYVNVGNFFEGDADIDRELSNFIDYVNQSETTKRLSQIDTELGTNYIKGRNWLLNEYSNGNIKLNKLDRYSDKINQSSTQPMMEFLSNPTYKNMKTDIVRQDPTPVVGHELKHGMENYLEVLNYPNMTAQKFRELHGTGKRLQGLFDKENIREFEDFYSSMKKDYPLMSDEHIAATYKYLTSTTEFSSNLQPLVSANMMRGRAGVPNYKSLEDFEDVMNNTFKLSPPIYHDPMMYSKMIYNNLVKDKKRFLDTFNKYGFMIATPIIGGTLYGNDK